MNQNIISAHQLKSERGCDYQSTSSYENSEVKIKQRELIYKFITDNYDNYADDNKTLINPRYIGLPGKDWALETMLRNDFRNASVTGFEKNHKIFVMNRGMMPIKKDYYPFEDRKESVFKGYELEWRENVNCIYLYGDINTFTDDESHEIITASRQSLRKGLTNRNVVWYDFTSPLNIKSYLSIYNLKNVMRETGKNIVCFTMMYGRDTILDGDGEQARIDTIKRALPNFEPMEYWRYKGFKDTPMINICGVVRM